MYRLIAEGTELTLPENYKPEISLNFNEIAKQSGNLVLPLTLPNSAINSQFFQFASNPQSHISRTKKQEAILLFGSTLIAKGFLVLKVASQKGGYTVELQAPPALVSMDIWEKNIRELDFGKITLGTTTVTENAYHFTFTETIKNKYYPNIKTQFTIKINGIIYSECYANFSHPDNIQKSFDEIYPYIIDSFNILESSNFNENNTERLKLDYVGNSFILYTPTNNYNVTMTFRQYNNNQEYPIIDDTLPFSILEYESPVFDSFLYNTSDNSMFCLPAFKNAKIYSEYNEGFSGKINHINNGSFVRNSILEPNYYTLSPCLYFTSAIKKLLELFGYTATGDFFSNAAYKKAYFITSVTLDKKCPSVDFTFNIFDTEITLAKHLPSMTAKEFLANICEQFGLDISFDVVKKTATVSILNTLIESTEVIDISAIVNPKTMQIEHQEHTKIQLAFESLSEVEKNNAIWAAMPTDESKVPGEIYKTINYKFKPVTLENLSNANTAYLTPRRNGTVQTPTNTSIPRYIPVIEQEGVSNLFAVSKNSPTLYIAFCVGVITPLADSMVHSLSETDGVSLQIVGTNGLYAKKNAVIAHIENTYYLSTNAVLTPTELYKFENWKKYHIHGINFFITSINGSFRETLKLKFRKV